MNKEAILDAVRHRPRLSPIFGSTHNIPERVAEYNPDLFLCHNVVTDRIEVHSLANSGDTFCANLPYKSLDARTIRWIWENDIRVHGKNIFKRIEASEQAYERMKQREYKNWIEDVGKETQSLFAKDAWTFAT
jgi:hypothetical protein